jgi:hypothetical protein
MPTSSQATLLIEERNLVKRATNNDNIMAGKGKKEDSSKDENSGPGSVVFPGSVPGTTATHETASNNIMNLSQQQQQQQQLSLLDNVRPFTTLLQQQSHLIERLQHDFNLTKDRESQLSHREAQVSQREHDITIREQSLSKREHEAVNQQAGLLEREAQVKREAHENKQDTRVNQWQAEVNKKEAQVNQRQAELNQKEAQANKRIAGTTPCSASTEPDQNEDPQPIETVQIEHVPGFDTLLETAQRVGNAWWKVNNRGADSISVTPSKGTCELRYTIATCNLREIVVELGQCHVKHGTFTVGFQNAENVNTSSANNDDCWLVQETFVAGDHSPVTTVVLDCTGAASSSKEKKNDNSENKKKRVVLVLQATSPATSWSSSLATFSKFRILVETTKLY